MSNNALVGIIILIIVVGIGIYAIGAGTKNIDISEVSTSTPSTNNTNNNTNNTQGQTTLQPANAITLSETETGNFVFVTATLLRPGYAVISNVNSQGTVTMIGHSDLLSAGTHTNVRIELDNVIARQQTIVAVLHADDGDGKFEFPDSDFYLGNTNMRIVNDVDVVDTAVEDEPALLKEQVDEYLIEETGTTSPSGM